MFQLTAALLKGRGVEMPPHTRMRVTLGELADRAADEETRRIAFEYGLSTSLRVTCRLV